MTETAEAKPRPPAGSGVILQKGARLGHTIQPGTAADPSPYALQHQECAKLDVHRDNRHGDLTRQISQCRAAGTQVLQAQKFCRTRSTAAPSACGAFGTGGQSPDR